MCTRLPVCDNHVCPSTAILKQTIQRVLNRTATEFPLVGLKHRVLPAPSHAELESGDHQALGDQNIRYTEATAGRVVTRGSSKPSFLLSLHPTSERATSFFPYPPAGSVHL